MKNVKEKYGRIGVLMGGYSSEREISLKSGKAILSALLQDGFDAVAIDIIDKDEDKIRYCIFNADIDIAFIALHGCLGEDGAIQSVLEDMNISYTGSSVQASRLAINKALTQKILKDNGLNVPPHEILSDDYINMNELINNLPPFPVVVKPACEGSSIGIKLVRQVNELEDAVKFAREFGNEIIIEQYIEGRELTVGILNGKALAVVEIRSHRDFFDFTAKYQSGLTEYLIPASLPPEITSEVQQMAIKTFNILGCQDISRVDFIIAEDMKPYILEINTIPGFTSTSLLPKAAQFQGINFNQLCAQLVELAYGKKKIYKNTAVRY